MLQGKKSSSKSSKKGTVGFFSKGAWNTPQWQLLQPHDD
jgi:hypothetical protein